jgi:hypothetical protein
MALFLLPPIILHYFLSNGLFLTGVKTSTFTYFGEQGYLPILAVMPYLAITAYIPVAYGIYPILFSMEKYSRKEGNENIVIESEFLNRLFVIQISLLSLSIISLFVLPKFGIDPFHNFIDDPLISYLNLYTIMMITIGNPVPISGVLLRIATLQIKKEFRFYFAKGCCEIISNREDDVQRMKYLFLLLDSYNKYLRRNSKFEISNINKMYSRILYVDERERNRIINAICESLGRNRLKLARFLSTIYEVPESELFVKEQLLQKLKVVGALLAAAIPIGISIVQLLLPLLFPSNSK